MSYEQKTRPKRGGYTGSRQLSFFPEPDSILTYPRKYTRPWQLLQLLLKGLSVTHPDFEEEWGCWRAAAAVNKLRGWGFPVQDKDVIHYSGKRKTKISSYFFDKEFIEKLKKRNK